MNQAERIQVDDAPTPRGAYSQVVRAGDLLFVSGQGPIDPDTQEFVFGDIRSETKLTLENVERVLLGCGATRNNIVKCGVFLAEAGDFNAMNEVYATFFSEGTSTHDRAGYAGRTGHEGSISDTRDGGTPVATSGVITSGNGNRVIQLSAKFRF